MLINFDTAGAGALSAFAAGGSPRSTSTGLVKGGSYDLAYLASPTEFGVADVFVSLTYFGTRSGNAASTVHVKCLTIDVYPLPPTLSSLISAPSTVVAGDGPVVRAVGQSSYATDAFVVAVSAPGLFATQPAVSLDGALTFTPVASGAGGTATIPISLRYVGKTAALPGGTVGPVTVTVIGEPPVPTFTMRPAVRTLDAGSPAVTIADWAVPGGLRVPDRGLRRHAVPRRLVLHRRRHRVP